MYKIGQEKKMKKIFIVILMLAVPVIATKSFAASPMPEEVQLNKTVCIVKVVHHPEIESGIPGQETSSTFSFDSSVPRKDALEKTSRYISDKTALDNVSEVKIDCRFAR